MRKTSHKPTVNIQKIFVKKPILDKQRELNRRMDRITLVGLLADFIAGFNLLPNKVLWAGKLSQRTSASLFFVASVVGLYKLF
jgi:hypothetical protein